MENTNDLATDALLTQEINDQITDAVTQEPQESDLQPEPQQEMSEVDMLINKRTGFFPIKLSMEDLKWIANACKSNKFTFVGPNEAFMVMNCYLGFSAALSRFAEDLKSEAETDGTVEVQASALEAAAILLNKYESSGLEAAQRVFRIAIALNNSVMEMKELDRIINQIKVGMAKQDELDAIASESAQA